MPDDDGSITGALLAWKGGDRDSVGRLWAAYFHRLVGLARGRLDGASRPASDEEDVALSAFASFCRRAERGEFPHLDDREGLWKLLFVITVRKAINRAKHGRRARRGGGRVSPATDLDDLAFRDLLLRSPTPEAAAEMDEDFRGLLDALGVDRTRRLLARIGGDDSIDTLAAGNNLATALLRQGRLAEAEAASRRVLDGYRRALDALRRSGKTRHPEYLSLLNNYAIMLPRRGEVDRAEAAFREILAIRREVLGPPHPETLMPMNNLADFLTSTGRVTESELLQREALGMLDRAPDRGATSEVAFMTRANLAEILAERGEIPEAERLYRAALDTALAVWGPDHSNTKIIQARLAEIRRPRPDGPTPRP